MCLTGQSIGRAALDPLNISGQFGDPQKTPAPIIQQVAPAPTGVTTAYLPAPTTQPKPANQDKEKRTQTMRQHSDLMIPS